MSNGPEGRLFTSIIHFYVNNPGWRNPGVLRRSELEGH